MFWNSFFGPDQAEAPLKIVVGLIAFKGKIQLHSLGARAEEAQILQLATIKGEDIGLKEKEDLLKLKIRPLETNKLASHYQVKVTDINSLRKKGEELKKDQRFLTKENIKGYIPKPEIDPLPGLSFWRNFIIFPTGLFLIANFILMINEKLGINSLYFDEIKIKPLDFDQAIGVALTIFIIGLLIASTEMVFKTLKRTP